MKKEFFNITLKEINEKKYNIFIGISLGVLKPFTKELAKEYLDWALSKTKEKVVILIADEIAKYNYRIFSKYSEGKSYREALKEGDKYAEFFKKIIKDFSKEKQEKILILRWKDIWEENLEETFLELKKKYESNNLFKEKIISFVRLYAEKRNKNLSSEQLNYLSQYILAEIPTLLKGIEFENKKYKLLLYPTFAHSGMSDFIKKLEEGLIFQELKNELSFDKSVAIVEFHLPVIKS